MAGTFSQTELIQSVDLLKVTVPRMNKLSIPLTPNNYAVWYEYSQGTTLALNKEIDDHLNGGGKFGRRYNELLYKKYIAEQDKDSVSNIQNATQSVIENLISKIHSFSDGTTQFGGALGDCKQLLEVGPNIDQLTMVLDRVLDETEAINSSNQEMMSNLASMEQEVALLRSQMGDLADAALKDQLTRVANRRAFEQGISELLELFQTEGSHFCLLILDIDHFKQFNDNYGHAVGDKVLTYVASSLSAEVENEGFVARYGGEEFVILLPGFSYDDALKKADLVRKKVSMRNLTTAQSSESIGKITISAGVALVSEEDDITALMERADKSLYLAKKTGRNRVCGERDLGS